MNRPTLKPTQITNERFANLIYHIEGELVPSLTVEISPEQPIFFEHHVMLWKTTPLETKASKLSGSFKRVIAGMPILLLVAHGKGQIAFSRQAVGQIYPIHLEPGQEIDVREHQYLAATSNLSYTFSRVKGFSNVMFGGSGFFIDKFKSTQTPGIVWLHGYGNVFEKHLEPGEQIDVDSGSWVYKDPSVEMQSNLQRFSTGVFGSTSLICNRFTGPGRVGIQSQSNPMQDLASDSARAGGVLGLFLSK